jgi:transcriptional regulator of NAD metabolism
VTEGIHIHTIAVKDEEAFSRIVARLSELGILVETN